MYRPIIRMHLMYLTVVITLYVTLCKIAPYRNSLTYLLTLVFDKPTTTGYITLTCRHYHRLQPSLSVRNLGVLFDVDLSLHTSISWPLAVTVLCDKSRVVGVHSVVAHQLHWLTVLLSPGWTIATVFSLAAANISSTNFNAYWTLPLEWSSEVSGERT